MHRLLDKTETSFFGLPNVSHPGRSFLNIANSLYMVLFNVKSFCFKKSNHSFHQLRTWLGLSTGTNGPDGHGDAECHAQCTKSSNLAGSGGWVEVDGSCRCSTGRYPH